MCFGEVAFGFGVEVLEFGVGVGDGEVGGVPYFGLFAAYVDFEVGDIEALGDVFGGGECAQGVALLLGGEGVEGVGEEYVFVEGVVFRGGVFDAVAVIEGNTDGGFFGEEAVEVELCRDVELIEVVEAAVLQGLFDASESGCLVSSGEADGAGVGEIDGKVGKGCPSAVFVVVGEAELIDPDFYVFDFAGLVAHANHEGLYVAEVGVADDGDFVLRVIGVVLKIGGAHGGAGG